MTQPTPDKKIEQHNFHSYAEMRSWLQTNQFVRKGYVTEEPWREFFIEQWEKDELIAWTLNLTFLSIKTVSLESLQKPYQVDIALK